MNFNKALLFTILSVFCVNYITLGQLSNNWFNMDPSTDNYAGVSSDRTYSELIKNKTATPVIVAVIDGGTDVNHPDLVDNLWVNPGEIPGNGIDDDNNGYVDDLNGWSFIGGKEGDVDHDTYEAVRVVKKYQAQFEGKSKSSLSKEDQANYEIYQQAKAFVDKTLKESQKELDEYKKLLAQMDELKSGMNKENFTGDDIKAYPTSDAELIKLRDAIGSAMNKGVPFDDIYKEIKEGYDHYDVSVNYQLNAAYDPRNIVGDHYEDYTEKYYGNNHVAGPEASHGTHVAGIIGASRENNIGIKGVATPVKLMILRVVPDGDERDKDVANAIRYAADNGAKVINMSFGKSFSPGKKYVDEAIRYAASKDVLMVHAAGNDSENNDKFKNYPNPFYQDNGEREPAWIEVGALSSSGAAAKFSNYGVKSVDVFAPGVSIYSTLPDGEYGKENGTSMASPMVAGIAALLRAYYPSLSAPQIRKVIMDSALPVPGKTLLPGSKKKKVKFSKLCVSGGMANVYAAFGLCASMVN